MNKQMWVRDPWTAAPSQLQWAWEHTMPCTWLECHRPRWKSFSLACRSDGEMRDGGGSGWQMLHECFRGKQRTELSSPTLELLKMEQGNMCCIVIAGKKPCFTLQQQCPGSGKWRNVQEGNSNKWKKKKGYRWGVGVFNSAKQSTAAEASSRWKIYQQQTHIYRKNK